MRGHRPPSRARRYFTLVLGWSTTFYTIAALISHIWPEGPIMLFHALGGLGPLLVALFLLYQPGNAPARRDFWRRLVDVGRIPRRWLAVTLFLVPVTTGLVALLDLALGGWGIRLEAAARFTAQPLALIPFALFILLFGPLPEELGWRGYALDRLQTRHSALVASLILGALWACWHLPLFFVVGSYQHSLGLDSISGWRYLLILLPDAILYTWIYNNSRRSTLIAVLFHFVTNFTGELFTLSPRAELFFFAIWIALAAIVALRWRATTLGAVPNVVLESTPA